MHATITPFNFNLFITVDGSIPEEIIYPLVVLCLASAS